jgi:hypothetical protein
VSKPGQVLLPRLTQTVRLKKWLLLFFFTTKQEEERESFVEVATPFGLLASFSIELQAIPKKSHKVQNQSEVHCLVLDQS